MKLIRGGHKKTWRRTPEAWWNTGATKIPLPLRSGDKKPNYNCYKQFLNTVDPISLSPKVECQIIAFSFFPQHINPP